MSNRSRLAVLLAGVVVVVLAFVLLRPSGDDGAAPTATVERSGGVAAPEATATQAAPAATTPAGTPPAETTPAAPEEPEVPVVRIREDGSVAGGVQELEFGAGDEVEFQVRSAIDEEIHVHGYDVVKGLRAGRTTTFRFEGDLEGIFEVELHGAARQVAELRVSPS